MAGPRGGAPRKKSARRPGAEGGSPEGTAEAALARPEKGAAADAEGEKRPVRKPVRPVQAAEGGGFRGRLEEFSKYLKSVRAELKRVTWPGWPEVRAATIVVVLTLVIISGYMGIADWVLTQIFGTPTIGF